MSRQRHPRQKKQVPHLPRETQVAVRKIMPVRHVRNPIPTAEPPARPQRNACWPCVFKTRRNPTPTAQRRGTPAVHLRHTRGTSNTLDRRSLPRETMPRSHHHPRRPRGMLAMHAAQRERRFEPDSRTGSRLQKPRRGHPAAIIEKIEGSEERFGSKILEQDDVT